jgi:hypothetical protein
VRQGEPQPLLAYSTDAAVCEMSELLGCMAHRLQDCMALSWQVLCLSALCGINLNSYIQVRPG